MKLQTTEDVLDLLDAYLFSAALDAAMELGLFWLLAARPLPAPEVARCLNIPLNRCTLWLQMLGRLGLIEEGPQGYVPSAVAREAILNAHSRDSWAFLAREGRWRFPSVGKLAVDISKPVSTWEAPGLAAPSYLEQIAQDPGYAASFTRMLYELHLPLAAQLARVLDLRGVRRLMDLGGGSGGISFALLHKNPELTSVVVDAEAVCQVGRGLALENGLEQRVAYLAADFLHDDLPGGYDMVLLCDSGRFDEALYRKIYQALNAQGRIVVVEQLAPDAAHPAPSHLAWAFQTSLECPSESVHLMTAGSVQALLQEAGFHNVSTAAVPYTETLRWNTDWVVVEARK